MDPLTDPRCLVTTETLMIDGANGICRDPRLGDRADAAHRAVGLALGALVVLAILLRAPARAARASLLIVMLLATGPGLWALLAERADRPSGRAQAAMEVSALHDRLRAFALDHGCAQVHEDRCAGCMPVSRLATSDLRCDLPAQIVLEPDAFGGDCVEERSRLRCGGAR